MGRMHGERQQDYVQRRLVEEERRAKTAAYLQEPPRVVEVRMACGCDFLPYPHLIQEGTYLKEVHDGPPDLRYCRQREWLWKRQGLEYREKSA
jgi:hypothetical protein